MFLKYQPPSSLTFSELMSLMDSDADEHNSDANLIESPTHVFPHNLPDYVIVDVDSTTVVTDLQDIPQLSPTRSIVEEYPVEELPPVTNEDPTFWSEVCSFCDSISALDHSFNQSPTLRSPSCLLDDNPSFRVDSPKSLMFWDKHNPWKDVISEDSDYTPFDDEFSQD
ncbi:hypothetical protein L1987_63726 [Smallanthus sonchifolius]|uniref:Uncharacterized protein n=1 Tax=Smallanthus sonchifolius TaxID=185202 RepID=A0ACB9CE38_9ASTR|nr:hypothetical protein L1987_63726 [Smallanthus sonchifolius]